MKEAFEKIRKRIVKLYGETPPIAIINPRIEDVKESNAYLKCLEIVSEVEAEYGNGWIPCSERLPENEDYVLCWYEYKIMGGTCNGELNQTYGVGWFFKRNKSWLVDSSIGINAHVIAWMSLPSPYKPTTD